MIFVWSPRAIAHLAQLREFIVADNPLVAARTAESILQAVELLADYPAMGRAGRVSGTRELVVSGAPLVIPYRVKQGRLEIIAVFHGRQQGPARL